MSYMVGPTIKQYVPSKNFLVTCSPDKQFNSFGQIFVFALSVWSKNFTSKPKIYFSKLSKIALKEGIQFSSNLSLFERTE